MKNIDSLSKMSPVQIIFQLLDIQKKQIVQIQNTDQDQLECGKLLENIENIEKQLILDRAGTDDTKISTASQNNNNDGAGSLNWKFEQKELIQQNQELQHLIQKISRYYQRRFQRIQDYVWDLKSQILTFQKSWKFGQQLNQAVSNLNKKIQRMSRKKPWVSSENPSQNNNNNLNNSQQNYVSGTSTPFSHYSGLLEDLSFLGEKGESEQNNKLLDKCQFLEDLHFSTQQSEEKEVSLFLSQKKNLQDLILNCDESQNQTIDKIIKYEEIIQEVYQKDFLNESLSEGCDLQHVCNFDGFEIESGQSQFLEQTLNLDFSQETSEKIKKKNNLEQVQKIDKIIMFNNEESYLSSICEIQQSESKQNHSFSIDQSKIYSNILLSVEKNTNNANFFNHNNINNNNIQNNIKNNISSQRNSIQEESLIMEENKKEFKDQAVQVGMSEAQHSKFEKQIINKQKQSMKKHMRSQSHDYQDKNNKQNNFVDLFSQQQKQQMVLMNIKKQQEKYDNYIKSKIITPYKKNNSVHLNNFSSLEKYRIFSKEKSSQQKQYSSDQKMSQQSPKLLNYQNYQVTHSAKNVSNTSPKVTSLVIDELIQKQYESKPACKKEQKPKQYNMQSQFKTPIKDRHNFQKNKNYSTNNKYQIYGKINDTQQNLLNHKRQQIKSVSRVKSGSFLESNSIMSTPYKGNNNISVFNSDNKSIDLDNLKAIFQHCSPFSRRNSNNTNISNSYRNIFSNDTSIPYKQ